MGLKEDVTVVVRSVGERTEQLCMHKLAQEVPESNIKMIRNQPLHRSTALVCHAAINAGRKYTIMIGADYIPRVGFIQDLYDMAESMEGDWLFVKGTIIDKFLLDLRGDQGGPMLYPTNILRGWLRILPTISNQRTTEASCQRHYKQKGFKTLRGKVWLALHDYEQRYQDIYRSMFVAGKKHNKHATRLLPRWKQLARDDLDYQVACYAYLKGGQFRGDVIADFRKDYGWNHSPFIDWEKEPITDMEYDVQKFEHLQYLKQKGKK